MLGVKEVETHFSQICLQFGGTVVANILHCQSRGWGFKSSVGYHKPRLRKCSP